MENKRKIEVFSAGCGVCDETIKMVKEIACDSCDVDVLDMQKADVLNRAKAYGVKTVPSVVIDGKLAECCGGGGVNAEILKAAGLGEKLECCG